MNKSIQKFLMICGIIFLGLILLVAFNWALSQEYQWSKEKWCSLGVTAAAGFVDGTVNGFEFDGRKSFERKWNVRPISFFGSRSWETVDTGWERQFGALVRGEGFTEYQLPAARL